MDSTMDALVTGELICLSDASDDSRHDSPDSPVSMGSGCVMVDVEPVPPAPKLDGAEAVSLPSLPGDADAAAGPPPLPDFSDVDVVSDTWDDGRPQHEVTPDPVDSPASPTSVESMHVSEVPDSDSEVSDPGSDPMGTTLELDPSPYPRRLRDVTDDPIVPSGSSSTSGFPRFTMTLMGKFHSVRIGGVVDEMGRAPSPKESERVKEA